jgi:simple sugar transport system ATP-binding protein
MTPAVELRGIRKAFGGALALDDVSLSARGGSIHALVGENGAGKSTAMKILYGQVQADSGEILLDGRPARWRSPAQAIAAGLGMVHQHFMLAGSHNAVENVLLAAGGSPFGLLGISAARERLRGLMRELRMEVRLDLPVEELSVGEQQRLEILKLVYRDSRILILDEPTAVLAPAEVDGLFAALRGLASGGKTILLITHKLKEVLGHADRVTVLRAGRITGTREVRGATIGELASLMVGRELSFAAGESRPAPRPELVLELQNVVPAKPLRRLGPVSFRLHAGEILGVAGVEGNGQQELIRLLLHPRACIAGGRMNLLGRDITRSARLRHEAEVGVFPEDRLREALLLEEALEQNFLLGRQRAPRFRRLGCLLDAEALRAATLQALRAFDVRPPDPLALAAPLSGGNQQKFVVARELSGEPRFLIAAQPTRGVDLVAIECIHGSILGLRARGSGVLLISSDLDEILKLSDRVLVLYRGRVAGSFARAELSEEKIGLLMAGGSAPGGSA